MKQDRYMNTSLCALLVVLCIIKVCIFVCLYCAIVYISKDVGYVTAGNLMFTSVVVWAGSLWAGYSFTIKVFK